CLSLVTGSDPLVDALNGFGPAYRAELMAAMLVRLGVRPKSAEEDAELVQASFQGMAEGGERLRWEPFFFDWFCGSADRAMAGPRADLYAEDAFAGFRERLAAYAPERPERLAHAYFAQAEPEELLYDQIEALWAFIAEADDWTAFHEKLARIETARIAYSL
ncbi:MAG: selenoprotein O, partial [Phenylobacterium sp.]|nr:selenoprotein O [Phenylobacterium sp.]